MNFEKIEIYGFKSFADKAEIKFGNGITGIVGPNGCGKSNVADAIRWVLGEQSAGKLRGSSMQDVIFSGTQNRKSLSYCEVSLVFDNSTRMFSIDYNEVIITRKLYRSGESEYFLNKQPTRLKDIIELLHECGIGKEGYTIIGQGKVEEIMSAKPENRRQIFEEATGIAKFKTRKNESERKLERTHENLIRYSDILLEIENQLGPLEKQAEKAKEFNRLSEELKHNEINLYIAKVDGVGKAKERISVRLKGIEEQTAIRQKEYQQVQEEYEKIFVEISNADERLRKLNDTLLEKRVGMEKSSGAKRLFEEKISFLNGQIESHKINLDKNLKLLNECDDTIKENRQKKIELSEKLTSIQSKLKTLNSKLLTLSEKLSLSEELTATNRRKIIESIESLTDIKVNKGTLSIEKESLLGKKEELMTKLDELSVKREQLFNSKDASDKTIDELDRAVYDYKNQIAGKEEEVKEGNEKVAKFDNSIYTLNSQITSLVTKDNFYRELKENYEGYNQSVKALLNASKTNSSLKSKIKGVVAEIINSDKKFDIALETCLASAAQNIVTATPDDAKFLIEHMKANRMGRATFLPITSVKPRTMSQEVTMALKEKGALGVANKLVTYDSQYENIISNLLGNTLIVDSLENANAIAKRYRFAFKIVTLDGDVFSTQGAMTGGSRRAEGTGILSNDRKIEDNLALLQQKREEMQKLKEQKTEEEKGRDKAFEELSILNDIYNEKRQQVIVAREKQTIIETNLSEIGREIESVSELIDGVSEKINKLSEDYKSVESGVVDLEANRQKVTSSADKDQAEYDDLRRERDSLSEEIASYNLEATTIQSSISSIDNENERLISTIEEGKASNERINNNIESALVMIEELRLEQEKVALTKEEQQFVENIRKDIDSIEEYKLNLREKLNKNGDLRDKITEELTQLSEKKHLEEIELTKIDSDLEYMGQSIQEDYGEDYDSAQKYKQEGYDAEAGEIEIGKLRRKRSSLGAINATAIEESALLKARYEEMTIQKADLEKAEADLKEAITKIKTEMLTQFDEGFKKINENFQKIFKELFGGGRAMLQMDYSEVDDKLEAGVEIVAEPPGKKLQKLSLLSGGEKALTAIAILFAILRLRPMPFCVLDEVEAALDEANVDRFAKYLKKFSDETQFIVITHKKPTMERADALFGVTMQEKGVSKMVSVKLSDITDMDADKLS